MTQPPSGLAALLDHATRDLPVDSARLVRGGITRGRRRRRRATTVAATLAAIGGTSGVAALHHRPADPQRPTAGEGATTGPTHAPRPRDPRVLAPLARIHATLTSLLPTRPRVRLLGSQSGPDSLRERLAVGGTDLVVDLRRTDTTCPQDACVRRDGGDLLLVEPGAVTLWTVDGWKIGATGDLDTGLLTSIVTAPGYLVDPDTLPPAPDPRGLRALVPDDDLVPTLRSLLPPGHEVQVTQTRFSGFGETGFGKLVVLSVDGAEVTWSGQQFNPQWRLDHGYEPIRAIDECDPELVAECVVGEDGSILARYEPAPDGGVGIPADHLSSSVTLWTADGWRWELQAYNTAGEKAGPKVSDLPPLTTEEMAAVLTATAWYR